MRHKINVVCYNASLQKLAFSFHSGNEYLDQFLRQRISLDDNFGKTYVFLSEDNKHIKCIPMYIALGMEEI
jgi:hypothetical protein